MKILIFVLALVFIADAFSAEKVELTYKLDKGDILTYEMERSGKGSKLMTTKEGEEWQEGKPYQRSGNFSVKVIDVVLEDEQEIYELEFNIEKAKPFNEGTSFTIKMTTKGNILFDTEEERKNFLTFDDRWRSLYIGLVFPQLPDAEISQDEEFDSPDFIRAYDRDYNRVYSEVEVFIDRLMVTNTDESSGTMILEGSQQSEFEWRKRQLKYDIIKLCVFGYSEGLVLHSLYKEWHEVIRAIDHSFPPMRSDDTWEAKLLKINGEEVEQENINKQTD